MDLSRALQLDTTEGVWIKPDSYEDVEFRVRAFTPKYNQRSQAALVKLARAYQTLDAVPSDLRERSDLNALFDECVLEVKNLENNGKPMTLDEVRAVCATPEGMPLLRMVRTAVQRADNLRASDADDVLGNSKPSSTGKRNTATSPSSSPA